MTPAHAQQRTTGSSARTSERSAQIALRLIGRTNRGARRAPEITSTTTTTRMDLRREKSATGAFTPGSSRPQTRPQSASSPRTPAYPSPTLRPASAVSRAPAITTIITHPCASQQGLTWLCSECLLYAHRHVVDSWPARSRVLDGARLRPSSASPRPQLVVDIERKLDMVWLCLGGF